MRKKSHEQFVRECAIASPTVNIIGQYVGAREKVLCKCVVCAHEWETIAGNILRGHGCPHCAGIQTGIRCKKTHDEYVIQLQKINPTISVIGDYIGADKNILHKCNVCNYEWSSRPANLLQGNGCPQCAGRCSLTNEQWLKRFRQNNSHDITPTSDYIDSHTKVTCKCNVCGNVFSSMPYTLEKDMNCPKCAYKINARKATKSHKDFLFELSQSNPNIDVLDEYSGANTKVKCRCRVCNYEWSATPNHILHNTGCPHCAGNIKYTHDSFVTQIPDHTIKIVGKYENIKKHIQCECMVCGNTWNTSPDRLLRGAGCPKCKAVINGKRLRLSSDEFKQRIESLHPEIELLDAYETSNQKLRFRIRSTDEIREATPAALQLSGTYGERNYKGEEIIASILDAFNVQYIHGKRFGDLRGRRNPLEYDFYLPNHQTLVEYQGEQHLRPINYFGGAEHFAIQQEHDRLKREYAKEHDMKLIEIWYYDYDRIEEILIKELELETAETAG